MRSGLTWSSDEVKSDEHCYQKFDNNGENIEVNKLTT